MVCLCEKEGLIVKGIAGFYYVKSGEKVYRCKARGIFKQKGIKPMVGDRVIFEEIPENDDSIITDILPRKNCFIRPPVSNVDCFVIVVSVAEPDPVLPVIDRFMVMAEKNETDILLCINKCDIADGDDNKRAQKAKKNKNVLIETYQSIYPMVFLSMNDPEGYEEMKNRLKGKVSALTGPSGTGKSTILNHIIPEAFAETGDISRKSQRGRHTTRHSELFPLDGSEDTMIFDTPGFTSFDILETSEEELQQYYPEIRSHAHGCKYHNCRHISEPECKVRKAVDEGKIQQSRYESYCSAIDEIRKNVQY